MNKCKKIISLVLAVVMVIGAFALSAMTATGDTDNKIYAFKFSEDDYKPGMATNPADSYYTENDGTLVLESNEIHKQYQMYFSVNEKNASRLEEAVITACRYYDGVLATEVHIPWAKNKWGYNCSPEIGVTFMNSAQKTVCKADIARYAPDTMEPHQVLMDVTCFIDPETGEVNYNNEIKYVYVQIQCYDWGCGSDKPDGGTRGKYTISPFYVVTGKEEVNTIPTEKPDPNQQTLLNFGKANKKDYDNAPSSRKYSADGVVWKSEGMATAENAGFLEMRQINTFNQMQVNYGFEHGEALKNAFNLAKSDQGTGYAKFTVNIVQCLDYNTRKDMIAEIKFAVGQSEDSDAQYQEFTAWQYPGTSRTYYVDLTRYGSYQELSSLTVAIQNYWHVKTNPDGTKEIFDYDREINWDQSLDRSEELGYVRTYLFNTTVIVSPVVVIPKTAEANHTFKNTTPSAVLNKFNADSCVVPATEQEKVSIDPNADGYKGGSGGVVTTTAAGGSGGGSTTTKIAAPKVSSAAVIGKNQIRVKYGKVSGAKYYQLYRKVNTGAWKKIKTVASKYLYITDKTASAAGTYQYRVCAVDAGGKVSGYSNIKKVTGVMSFSAKPTIKLASIKKGVKVTLSKKVTNAGGYQIQYSKKKTMKSAKTTTMKKTAKYKNVTKLTGKTRYYVRVRAYKVIAGKKQYGKWSAIKYVTTKK